MLNKMNSRVKFLSGTVLLLIGVMFLFAGCGSAPNESAATDEDHSVSVTRDFMPGSSDTGEINVILSVKVDDALPNGLIIQEYVPKGWEVQSSIPLYRTFNSETGEIKWLFIGSDVGNMKINYKIVKTEDSAGMLSLSGNYLYNDPDGVEINRQTAGKTGI